MKHKDEQSKCLIPSLLLSTNGPKIQSHVSNVIILTFSLISSIALVASSASRSARLPVNRLITVYKVLRSASVNNAPLRPLPSS